MQTKVISSKDLDGYEPGLAQAAKALRDGALVVFPTETVYGVAANAAHADAVARLRAVKVRSGNTPFTVHLASRIAAKRYVPSPSPLARRLARRAWPGPLTLICQAPTPTETDVAQVCPPEQLGEIFHEGTVGLRCPDHAAAQRLLGDAEVPVVASSANRSGQPPPFDARDALRDLDGQVDYVIDAGRTPLHAASTIVSVRGNDWEMVREGALDARTIRRLATTEILAVCSGNSCRSPMAEHLFRHKLARALGYDLEQLAAAGYALRSAGTFASLGGPASAGSSEEMARRGIDLKGHRSQPLTVELLQRAERIYVMTPEHREAVLDLAPAAAPRVQLLDPDQPVADPIGAAPEQYRRCAEQIERAVERRLEEFLHDDRDW